MSKKGFTLIELMIVIAIIGILVAAIAPRYMDFTTEAKIATTQSNLSSLRGAITVYAGKNDGSYPSALGDLTTTYIQKIPENKVHGDATTGTTCDGNYAWAYNDGVVNACDGATTLNW